MEFDTFFADSRDEMLARALMMAGSRHDAEDAVQEAYAEALLGWDRISGYDNPGAWVFRIVRQRLWKSARRWRRVGSADLTTWRATEGDPERFTEATFALAALITLPNRQRAVMVMHCLHEMSQQEIADELGLSRGTVAATVFKARRKLAKALGMTDTMTGPSLRSVSDQDPLDALLFRVTAVLTDDLAGRPGGDDLAAIRRKAGV